MAFKSDPALFNVDDDRELERGVGLPWASDPAASYMYYDCTVMVMLDSGIVVHNRLPQVDKKADTLGAVDFDSKQMDQVVNAGVNLRSKDDYEDIKQRMAHSRYWFNLRGSAIRVGYRVPIPSIKMIGGQEAIPHDKNPQWAFNRIAPGGNFGGVIMWYAEWSLWYTTLKPPISDYIPASDPSAHIRGDAIPPKLMQAPYSGADDNAQVAGVGATIKLPEKPTGRRR